MNRLLFLGLACALLLLAACDDPSNVGIGLVDDQGRPEVRTFDPAFFDSTPLNDITGGVYRALAGEVTDPLLGTITATGYFDFETEFDTVNSPAVTGATLRLRRDYIYGDTTAEVSLTLYDLIEDWNEIGTTADTTLTLGTEVLTLTFPPADTLISVDLPEAWIEANADRLRSDDFDEVFHGFALKAASTENVVGFQAGTSVLRVFTAQDTSDFPVVRTLSQLERSGEPAVPDDRVLIQDGLGPGIEFDFPFEDAALQETPINGAFIRLHADTTALQATPPHFTRPLLRRLQLVAVEENASIFLLATAILSDDGTYVFQAPPTANVLSLRELLQRVVFDQMTYTRFELRFPQDNNSINPIFLYGTSAAMQVPQAVLTLSPSN